MKFYNKIYTSIYLLLVVLFTSTASGQSGPDKDGDPSNTDENCLWYTYDYYSECISEVTLIDGHNFFIHPEYGTVMYGEEEVPEEAIELNCLQFCPDYKMQGGVINASAITLSNYGIWMNNTGEDMDEDANNFETGYKGKWKIANEYVYKTDVTNINQNNSQVFDAGIMKDFALFDHSDGAENENWLNINTNAYYSPNQNLLQTRNALYINACTKYGYNGTLPFLVAHNATYNAVVFESFEKEVEDGFIYQTFDELSIYSNNTNEQTDDIAHSGSKAFKVLLSQSDGVSTDWKGSMDGFSDSFSDSEGSTTFSEGAVTLFDGKYITDELENGFVLKFWLYYPSDVISLNISLNEPTSYSSSAKFDEVPCTQIAQTGYWRLYEAKVEAWNSSSFSGSSFVSLSSFGASLSFNAWLSPINKTGSSEIYIDDICLKPANAQINAYVYDPNNLKLLTTFDDQLFGTYYQYNAEGKLIRIIKETIRGFKTIKETQYNVANQELVGNPSTLVCETSTGTIKSGVFNNIYENVTGNDYQIDFSDLKDTEKSHINSYMEKITNQELPGTTSKSQYTSLLNKYTNQVAGKLETGTNIDNAFMFGFYNENVKNNTDFSGVSYNTFKSMISDYEEDTPDSFLNLKF